MATHGRGGLGRALHGSVAAEVLRRSPIPVALVRAWEDGAARQPPTEHPVVLVPLDGSALAETALPGAALLASQLGATLVLLRVIPPPIAADAASMPGAMIDVATVVELEQEEARRYMAARAAKLAGGVGAETTVEVGPPSDAIVKTAVERRATAIVMGTHGHGGVLHAVFGSTAERVVRQAPCPVVLVRVGMTAGNDPAPPSA
jgi:nucleotide-binding universal stress UspA family protein